MDLSTNQQTVVEYLYKNPTIKLTSTEIANTFNLPHHPNIMWTPSQIHSILSRLEKRGIVQRNKGIPGRWQLTIKARTHLLDKGFKS